MNTNCPDETQIQRYVAGGLGEKQAADLEAHYFSCDRCFEQIELGIAVRAAVALERSEAGAFSPARASSRFIRWRPLLAAAAALVVIVIAVVWLGPVRRAAPVDRTVRGGQDDGASWTVEVTRQASALRLGWEPVRGAHSYLARLRADDGTILAEIEVQGSPARFDLSASALSELPGLDGLRAEVEALDGLRQSLRLSPPVDLGGLHSETDDEPPAAMGENAH